MFPLFAGSFPNRGNWVFCWRFKPGSSKANSSCTIGLTTSLELGRFPPWEEVLGNRLDDLRARRCRRVGRTPTAFASDGFAFGASQGTEDIDEHVALVTCRSTGSDSSQPGTELVNERTTKPLADHRSDSSAYRLALGSGVRDKGLSVVRAYTLPRSCIQRERGHFFGRRPGVDEIWRVHTSSVARSFSLPIVRRPVPPV